MDHRCPDCRANLGKRKLSQAIVARMEVDCPHCKRRIRLNIHRAEAGIVLAVFGTTVALGAIAYLLRSQGVMLSAFGAAMVGALALPILERTYLRTWPRYASTSH